MTKTDLLEMENRNLTNAVQYLKELGVTPRELLFLVQRRNPEQKYSVVLVIEISHLYGIDLAEAKQEVEYVFPRLRIPMSMQA